MEATVKHHLIQATDTSDFLHQDGPRKGKVILNMPYWIRLGNAWWFEFMRADMDLHTFKQNLAAGRVFILKNISE